MTTPSATRTRPATVIPTYRWERMRALCEGPFGAVPSALGLVVLVQVYDAPAAAKALIASAGFIGYLATTVVMVAVAKSRAAPARAFAGLMLCGAVAAFAAALSPNVSGFIAGLALSLALVASATPLNIAYWRQNVPDARRGRWFSRVTQLEALGMVVATLLMAWWMRDDASRYRPALAAVAVMLAVAAWCARRIPSRPLADPGANPLRALRWLARDRGFAWVNASWMVMGISNLMVLPLRVDWLANARWGLLYPAWEVQLLIVAVPAVVRLLALPVVGRLFDRMDFLILRMAINGCFAVAILCAFTPWLATQLIGAVCFGLAFSGGDVAWNLWVTKYAPAERTAEYMSVHVFLTGVRGSVAPYLGFGIAAALSPPAVAWMGVAGIAVASAMLIPEARRARRRRMAVDREPRPLSLDIPPGSNP